MQTILAASSRKPPQARSAFLSVMLRRGFSLIELVVVVAVVGILLALILPAVAVSREAARRVQCQNHLRQLGEASHAFHEVHGHLPMQNHTALRSSIQYGEPGVISAWGQLLPYLEQSPLHAQIDFTEKGELSFQEPPGSLTNASILAVHLPILTCPSDKSYLGGTNYRACLGTGYGSPHDKGAGAYYSLGARYRKATFSMITDGLSQTALCSERLVGDFDPDRIDPDRDIFHFDEGHLFNPEALLSRCARGPDRADSRHFSFAGSTWLLNGYAWVWYNHIATPNSNHMDCTNEGVPKSEGMVTARSLHPGGVHVCLADGAVRFISESIDLGVWRALGTRSENEPISELVQ